MQRNFTDIWMPRVWGQRSGRGGRVFAFRTTGLPTRFCRRVATPSTGGDGDGEGEHHPVPRSYMADSQAPALRRIYQQILEVLHGRNPTTPTWQVPVSSSATGYPKAPSRGLLSRWGETAWDKVDADVIKSSLKKARVLLPLDGSGDDDWLGQEGAKL